MNLSPDLITQDALRFAVPLWLAGLGETVGQRAGVLNVGIEGMMLAGALAGWTATVATGSAAMGMAAAAGAGVLLALMFGLVTLGFGADQVVTGTAVNLLAFGATGVGYKLAVEAGLGSRATQYPEVWTIGWLPFAALNQYSLFHVTVLMAVVLFWLLRWTRYGIELTAIGEYAAAADAAGIRVNLRRLICVLFGGATAGLAGSYLSLMFTHGFNTHMTAGRGFLALAMVIFGRWNPLGLLGAGLFFGYVYALENQLEVIRPAWLPGPQILQMAPYLLSLVVLAGLMGRTRAPAELARPFERT